MPVLRAVADGHARPAPAAEHQALEQCDTFADRSTGGRPKHGNCWRRPIVNAEIGGS
jgi:hypothetical protein